MLRAKGSGTHYQAERENRMDIKLEDVFKDSCVTAAAYPLYRAEKSEFHGLLRETTGIVVGLTLVPIAPKEPEDLYDILHEELDNTGGDIAILLPGEGLKLGGIYEVKVINVSKDWETGFVDDYDLKIVEHKGT